MVPNAEYIVTKEGKELIVPSDYLHYVENPDIAAIPQVSEDYLSLIHI